MLATLIPALPFLSFMFIGFLYLFNLKSKKISDLQFGYLASIAPIISFFITLKLFFELEKPELIHLFNWIKVEDFYIKVGFYIDNLTLFMMLFITFIGSLIHIYSIYYMRGEEGFGKFFAYLNLFMSSMLILVLASNPIFMFVGWEGVGVSSYLLISFYYNKKENAIAGNKAFIVNRIGDFGFLIAIALLFNATNWSGFDYIYLKASVDNISENTLILIAFFLFWGASAKSAQFPLFVWLPDAMAGPTPVSALIHAATMVTAGIYLIARFSFIYVEVEVVGQVIAYIGIFTALISALIATRANDIKKILAYSTISQLGYMFVAVGLGSYTAGLFHVFTHAFFKALLFLGAGAIIYALHHEQNIFNMGGLKDKLKPIFIPMLIATLAISGIFPLAGFFSKDEILFVAFSSGHYDIWLMGVFIAFLTAFYMFRMIFLVFFNKENKTHKILEVPIVMKFVLYILAIGSILAGFIGIPYALGGSNLIHHYLSDSIYELTHHSVENYIIYLLMLINTIVALLGIFIAYKKYYNFNEEKTSALNTLFLNKFYIDEIYDYLFVKSLNKLSNLTEIFINQILINKIVGSIILIYATTSSIFIRTQTGKIRMYAFYLVLGISSMFLYNY